uniref:Caspase family p20 domain-containing protein n=1 Tax=Parascaris equorum TaxID=6256 RepID=A0A914RAQ2_PAREQ
MLQMYPNFSSPRGLALIINNQHSLVDSCVVCILTHGEHGELFGVDDQGVSVFELISLLNAKNCPALAHKPKIFFLQACRGRMLVITFNIVCLLFYITKKFGMTKYIQRSAFVFICRSPIEADILISYATTPGYVSWRNSMKGSWFIQSICEIFSKYAKDTEILSMLTMVCFIPAFPLRFHLHHQKFPHPSLSHSMADDVSHIPSITVTSYRIRVGFGGNDFD